MENIEGIFVQRKVCGRGQGQKNLKEGLGVGRVDQ